MKFLNRRVLLHALVVLIITAVEYTAMLKSSSALLIGGSVALTIVLIILSALYNNSKDPYQAYFGFNYHLVTYTISCGVPAILIASGSLPENQKSSLIFMALCWGVGILVHLLIVLFVFRKRRIGEYDKKEIFS